MDHSKAVLVLSTENQGDLIEMLFDLGFVPLLRKNMMRALEKIRHERFMAVFIDRNNSDIDALEFVLNVRDIDQQIPVIVVGESEDESENQALSNQPNISLVAKDRKRLNKEIKEGLSYEGGGNNAKKH